MNTTTFDFFETVPPPTRKPAKLERAAPPSQEEQLAALTIGEVDPDLFTKTILMRQMAKGPGAPFKNKDGIWTLGEPTDWFASRGTGNSKIMVVGAYPSDEEKRARKVMMGFSGTLMTRTLDEIGVKSADCILTNVIRYYLPAKTVPFPIAVRQCAPYLFAEIAYYKPNLILCLGGLALETILGMDANIDEFRGQRFRLPDKPYEVAAIWHPAYVLRESNLQNAWKDDLRLVLDKKPLPPGATDYRVQDKLPAKDIRTLADLKLEVANILAEKETAFTIDTEYVGDNPHDCQLLTLQLATDTRTLNIIFTEGNWRPQIHLKNTGKGADLPSVHPDSVLAKVLEKGYEETCKETGIPEIALLATIMDKGDQWAEMEAAEFKRRSKENEKAAADWRQEREKREERIMTHGAIKVFNSDNELHLYLLDNPKLRNNLIAYVIGASYVFDAPMEEAGNALRPLFDKARGTICLRGHNMNVDLIRMKLKLGLALVEFNDVDTMLLALVLDEGQPRGLEDVCRRYLNAPNHKLELLLHMKARGLKGQPYCFVRPSILWKYGKLDARRNHDLVTPMLVALSKETERLWPQINVCKVPRLKVGDRMRAGVLYDDDLKVNAWSSAAYLYDAFFFYKMPQSRALAQPMEIGQPINVAKLKELIDWYEAALKQAIRRCQEAARPYWNPKGDRPDFMPSSPDQTAELLFKIRKLRPIKSTNKKDTEWTDEKHEDWLSDLEVGNTPKHKPATDGETLELLAEKDDIAKVINDTRFISTIVKSYLRKGGRWRENMEASAGHTRGLSEADNGSFQLMNDTDLDKYLEDTEAEIAAEREETRQRWAEHEKDQDSKAISLHVASNNRLYSCYYATLESHRLATKPNVSAIIKGETRYVKDIVGKVPPLEIRHINEAPQDWFLISADWKSAEVWMIGMLSWIRSKARGHEMDNLLKIISDPSRCVHSSTARKMFPSTLQNLSDKEIKKQYGHLRDMAKPVVFGIPYGRGAKAIAAQLNRNAINNWLERVAKGEATLTERPKEVTSEEASAFIDGYFDMAPEVWDFLNEQKSLVITPGFQVNPWGFVRRYTRTTNEAEISEQQREASNWQIQGGVACAAMMAMDRWHTRYVVKYPNLQMHLIDSLHDALKWVIHKSMLPYYEEIVDDVMGAGLKLPFEHPIPLGYDISFYQAYERKDFDGEIGLEQPDAPKKHSKTFLGKHGDTPENRAFYARHEKKSDFVRFLMKRGVAEDGLDRKVPLEIALKT